MKNIRGILDPKHKKSLRLGLLLLSTLFIVSASALVYARVIYERALDVGDTTGVTTGSGSTGSGDVSFTPASIMMLAVAALVISLSMFGFLRQASRHLGPQGRGASPTGLPTVSEVAGSSVSKPPEAPGISLPLPLPSMQGEDWEESPTKEKGEG